MDAHRTDWWRHDIGYIRRIHNDTKPHETRDTMVRTPSVSCKPSLVNELIVQALPVRRDSWLAHSFLHPRRNDNSRARTITTRFHDARRIHIVGTLPHRHDPDSHIAFWSRGWCEQ
jgi:hypothetical protein